MAVPADLLAHLRRARDLIDRCYAAPLALQDLAAVAGVSKFHFLRCFSAVYGCTPKVYLARRRVERAQDLLRSTDLTVTEICALVGYASLGSFSARFRAMVGASPLEYQSRWAALGAPRVPGCYVLMHGLSDCAEQRSRAARDPRWTPMPVDAAGSATSEKVSAPSNA